MPLVRYEIRNEYSLANPELYRSANKDDPQALLEGVSMAGLVGIVRQLGDLAEFAAEVFHDLHEELMTTAARSHSLMIRVQQLETEFPLIEKELTTKRNQIAFAYTAGTDWHASIRNDQNHLTQGDLPRFILNSYEECRGPPRLFLLDKFDVAGAGACLKRYTDPSFFKMEWASSELMKAEKIQREKKARKKKNRRRKNGETHEVAPANSRVRYSSLDLDQPGNNLRMITSFHLPNLHSKQVNDSYANEGYEHQFSQVPLDDFRLPKENGRVPSRRIAPFNKLDTRNSVTSLKAKAPVGRQLKVSFDSLTQKDDENRLSHSVLTDQGTVSMVDRDELKDNPSILYSVEEYEAVPGANMKPETVYGEKDGVINVEKQPEINASKDGSDDMVSEMDNYMDALATIESEIETDSEGKTKREVDLQLHSGHKITRHVSSGGLNSLDNMHADFTDADVNAFYNCDSSDEYSKTETSSQRFTKKHSGDSSSIGFTEYDDAECSHGARLERSPGSVLIPLESSSDKSNDMPSDGLSLASMLDSSEQQMNTYVLSKEKVRSGNLRSANTKLMDIMKKSFTSGAPQHECILANKDMEVEAERPENKESLDSTKKPITIAGDIRSATVNDDIRNSVSDTALPSKVGGTENVHRSSVFALKNEPPEDKSKPSFKRNEYNEPVIIPKMLQNDAARIDPQENLSGREIHTGGTTRDDVIKCTPFVERPAELLTPDAVERLSLGVQSDHDSKNSRVFEYSRDAGTYINNDLQTRQSHVDTDRDVSSQTTKDINEGKEPVATPPADIQPLHKDEADAQNYKPAISGSPDLPTFDIHDRYQGTEVTENPEATSNINCHCDDSPVDSFHGTNISKVDLREDSFVKEAHAQSEEAHSFGALPEQEADANFDEEEGSVDAEASILFESTHPHKKALSAGSFKNIFDTKPQSELTRSSYEVFNCLASSGLPDDKSDRSFKEQDTRLLNVIRPVKPAGADPPMEKAADVPVKKNIESEPPSPPLQHIKITFQSNSDSPLSLSPTSTTNILDSKLEGKDNHFDNQVVDLPDSLHPLSQDSVSVEERDGNQSCISKLKATNDFKPESYREFGNEPSFFSHEVGNQSLGSSEEIAVYSGRIIVSDEADTDSPESSPTSLSPSSSPRIKDTSFLNIKCSSPEAGSSPPLSHNISLGSSPKSPCSSGPHSPRSLKVASQQTAEGTSIPTVESDTKLLVSTHEQATDASSQVLPPPPYPNVDLPSLPGAVHVPAPPPLPSQLKVENAEPNATTLNSAPKSLERVSQRNDSLIAAIASHDKSTLKKVPKQDTNNKKPLNDREVLLEQIRNQSFNLRRTPVVKQSIPRPVTNINVSAILEKANAIRQAYEGSDEEEDDDWSGT
eukprot:TRINITY_DN440_c0_g2_i1.p1 TRINITY_DN440_c0_g2~~TRINITY_DN440_c0_g2_i1.p1  ORF type:complete len:1374 (+),score=304.54 TRINITY_DN440_c0_g2_i1:454-4575(+)